MRGVAVAVGAVTAIAVAALAGGLALRAQASDERLTSALVAAELRARPSAASAPSEIRATPAAAIANPEPSPVASPVPEAPPTRVGSGALEFKQTNTYNGNVVFVPEGCSGAFDVVLHFHGAHPYVKELIEKAELPAVVAVYNVGNGAERYGQAFQPGGTLPSLLKQIKSAAAPLCGGGAASPRRVALSAWSAGYAAAEKLITRPEDRQRVDAVLLADGLHAGFLDPFKRLFAPGALQAFRDFGELAKRGDKLFAITHSSIATDGYASTTECSKLLLKSLNVPAQGRFVSGGVGSFSVEGGPGEDKAAHIAQFRQMDATLFAKLRRRWAN